VILRARDIESMFATFPHPMALFDQVGRLVRSNHQYQTLLALDVRPDAMSGNLRDRANLFRARDMQERRLTPRQLPLARALRGDRLIGVAGADLRVRALDGRELDLHVVATPLSARDGRITGCIMVVHNITGAVTAPTGPQRGTAGPDEPAPDTVLDIILDAAVDAIDDGMLLYDATGRLVRANTAARALLGVAPDAPAVGAEMVEQVARQIEEYSQYDRVDGVPLPEDARPLARVLRREAIAGRETADAVRTLPDGSQQVLNISAAPVNEGQRLVGAVLLLRDATERHRLERQAVEHANEHANRIEGLFEAMTDGLVHYDVAGNIIRMNAEARQLLGYESASAPADMPLPASGKSPVAGTQAAPAVALTPLLGRVLAGETIATEHAIDVMIHRPASASVVLAVGGAPIRGAGGQVTGAVLSVRDVTALRRSDAARAEVMNTVSHEMRTPLSIITMGVGLVERRAERGLPPTIDALSLLKDGVAQMTRLVSDLIDVARMEGGRIALKLVPSDLRVLCRATAKEQMRTMQRAITLHLPRKPAIVSIDPMRIGQVLANLLSNALKYSSAEHPVSVRLRRQGNLAHVEVHDEGPGIPADAKAHLFERFYRVPGINALHGSGVGLGLGLFIARTLVELHGGTIGVDSVVGHGSTFSFYLPLLNAVSA
jgi:signal transduction histidine kinase